MGTCVDLLAPGSGGAIVLSCGVAHYAELYRIEQLDVYQSALYPGAIEVSDEVGNWCDDELSAYEQGSGAVPGLRYHYIYPTAVNWASGDTLGYCFLEAASGEQLTDGLLPQSIY